MYTRTSTLRFHLGTFALFLWAVLSIGCRMQHTRTQTCPARASSSLTGWVDQINDRCAVLIGQNDRIVFVAPRSLPKSTKEGDFLRKGQIDRKRRLQAEQTFRKMLTKRSRIPKVYVLGTRIPSSKGCIAQYQRGVWRRWKNKRDLHRKQLWNARRMKRFTRRPWLRGQKKRDKQASLPQKICQNSTLARSKHSK